MDKKENIERINTNIADRFDKVEKKLSGAGNIAELFEMLLTQIEAEFQVPFIWISVADTIKTGRVIDAFKSSRILKDRLNVIKADQFRKIFFSGLQPILVNKNLRPYYRLFPPNQKYFIKSLAMVPFKINGEVAGSWNNGDAIQSRYSPDMETSLLQKLSRRLSARLDELP
ncbi:MAG TPA: hypothetical protein PK424_04460 [Smithella sp.]|nr:hypothetical protein [Smithella sp.]